MIRIDVVLANVGNKTEQVSTAFHAELVDRLSKFRPDIRIRVGAVNSLTVSGVKDDAEHENILSIIQAVWDDDTWIPEAR